MRIFTFVDMHGSSETLKKLVSVAPKIGLFVNAGDFTVFERDQEKLLKFFDKIGKPMLIIPGNHESEDQIRLDIKKLKNIYLLDDKPFIVEDVMFLGHGGGGFSSKDKAFEAKAKKWQSIINQFPDKKIILVTHAPPFGCEVDEIHGSHAGCKSITDFIKNVQPQISISGHLHETAKKHGMIGKTFVLNPGYLGKIINVLNTD